VTADDLAALFPTHSRLPRPPPLEAPSCCFLTRRSSQSCCRLL
jgi:hypothetical protein